MLEVVKLTLAPTLAPVEKLPVPIVRIVEFTTAEPIVKSSGDKFAVDVELEILRRFCVATKFIVELPTETLIAFNCTFAPTFRKSPVTEVFERMLRTLVTVALPPRKPSVATTVLAPKIPISCALPVVLANVALPPVIVILPTAPKFE